MAQKEKFKHFQDNSRLWAIEEANIGDILTASDGSIFIYAGLKGLLVQSYIALLADGDLNTMKCNWEEKTSVAPATKEQRDLLFEKMKEAGYVWNADKKELKKINEKDMTQKERNLLIQDLCARLPYGVVVHFEGWNPEKLTQIDLRELVFNDMGGIPKPYLRPMSSMTEEEKEELRDTYTFLYSEYPWDDEDEDEEDVGCHPEPSTETYDWYNRKMFDYRGLIPMGLALETPEGMYNN